MSRYSKSYGKKLSHHSHANVQFDTLFRENATRPSATKSAGSIGKWGVTSFTSIRSTNINGTGRYDHVGSKRRKLDIPRRPQPQQHTYEPSSQDPFMFDADHDTSGTGMPSAGASEPAVPQARPRKFFKSRAADQAAAPASDRLSPPLPIHSQPEKRKNHSRQYSAKKFFTSGGTDGKGKGRHRSGGAAAAMPPAEVFPKRPTNNTDKPPIKLRIFKDKTTSNFVSETPVEEKTEPVFPAVAVVSDLMVTDILPEVAPSEIPADPKATLPPTVPPLRISVPSSEMPSVVSMETPPVIPHIQSVPEVSPEIPDVPSVPEIASVGPSTHSVPEVPVGTPSVPDVPPAPVLVEPSVPVAPEDSTESLEELALSVNRQLMESKSDFDTDSDSDDKAGSMAKSSAPSESSAAPQHPASGTAMWFLPSDTAPAPTTDDVFDKLTNLREAQEAEDAALERRIAEVVGDADAIPADCVEAAKDILQMTKVMDAMDAEAMDQPKDHRHRKEKQDPEPAPDECEDPERGCQPEPPAVPGRKKKGSIFKSRTLSNAGSKKRLGLYKHKLWHHDDGGAAAAAAAAAGMSGSQPVQSASEKNKFAEYEDDEFSPSKLTRVTTWPMSAGESAQLGASVQEELDETMPDPVTRVKINRTAKAYYTVVRNVKNAHQIQESGEFQELNDDVEYILDALQENNPIATRCLSAVSLAAKCMAPAFRMHVRAHGTVAKFFRALNDSPKNPSLSLCTATVMFVLSQDRLNMDLDRDSLELMLNLLDTDSASAPGNNGNGGNGNGGEEAAPASPTASANSSGGPTPLTKDVVLPAELLKNKQRVRELCWQMQEKGHAKHLNLDNITAGQLAMETLLSLTSRRAGEWFKEELRTLGGLDHLVQTLCDCISFLSGVNDLDMRTDPYLDKLRKVDRCLRVLENVTLQNEENQEYLLQHKSGVVMTVVYQLFRICSEEIRIYPTIDPNDKESTGVFVREALISTMKVLLNLTHDFSNHSIGSLMAGRKIGFIDTTLNSLLRLPDYVPEEKKFDVIILSTGLIINLVENVDDNRKALVSCQAPPLHDSLFEKKQSAVEALIELFYVKEASARVEEAKTDDILDGKKDEVEAEQEKQKSQEEFIEETIAKLLQKAGRHMENTMIAAYVALLIGYLMMEDEAYQMEVRSMLPDKNYKIMIAVLNKLYDFMRLTATNACSTKGMKAIKLTIKMMEACERRIAAELESETAVAIMDDVKS